MWSETLPYRKYREEYVPKFFPAAAKALRAKGHHDLLDAACGTGALALGFSPFVGTITGLDVEQPMLDAARSEAKRRKVSMRLVCAGIENAPADLGTFDIVTIGKAHWYLPKELAWEKLRTHVVPGGRILICYTSTHDGLSGRWAQIYRRVRNEEYRLKRSRISPNQFMAGSGFALERDFYAVKRRFVRLNELLLRALAFPGSTPEQLGSRKADYLEKIRRALEPHAIDGKFFEVVATFGSVFVRD